MQTQRPSERLEHLIGAISYQQKQELVALKLQFKSTYDSFKPVNILKNSLLEINESPDIKKNIGSTILGISGGLIMNKLVALTSKNPVMNVVGTVLQYIVGNYISNYNKKEVISNNK